MSKILAACSLVVLSFGIVAAGEIDGTLTKIDGTKITIVKAAPKGSPKGTKGEEVVLTLADKDKVKVKKGTYDKKAKTYTTGDEITSGLQDPVFSAKKGAKVHVTTDADNKVTDILVVQKKKKKTT